MSDPIITWTVLMEYGGHSVLRSNSKLHNNFGKMETHARPRMPYIILVAGAHNGAAVRKVGAGIAHAFN